MKRTQCSSSALIVALVYLDRLNEMEPSMVLSVYTIHRLILTALLLACKFLDDKALGNTFFADMVGCSCEELNVLESTMLSRLDYRLFVDAETYKRYARHVNDVARVDLFSHC